MAQLRPSWTIQSRNICHHSEGLVTLSAVVPSTVVYRYPSAEAPSKEKRCTQLEQLVPEPPRNSNV